MNKQIGTLIELCENNVNNSAVKLDLKIRWFSYHKQAVSSRHAPNISMWTDFLGTNNYNSSAYHQHIVNWIRDDL